MVIHDIANVEPGVRFPLPAPESLIIRGYLDPLSLTYLMENGDFQVYE